MQWFPIDQLTSHSRKQALVVDDSPLIRKLHGKMLEQLGFDVLAVSNGLEALTVLRDISFDVVLMDCEMPVMDGLSATRALRLMEQAKARKTPVIGITSSGIRTECSLAGMDQFLSKPISTEILAHAIERTGSMS